MAELVLYGDVFPEWGGVTAKQVKEDLTGIRAGEPLDVRINSYGGDVFEGLAVYRHLTDWQGKVSVHVDGVAASIASVIAMAGDSISMGEGARLMIHRAWTLALGDANEMDKTAGLLRKIDGDLVAIYSRRSSAGSEAIEAWMTDETWFNGAEAIEAGFADAIIGEAVEPEESLAAAAMGLRIAAGTERPKPEKRIAAQHAIAQRRIASMRQVLTRPRT